MTTTITQQQATPLFTKACLQPIIKNRPPALSAPIEFDPTKHLAYVPPERTMSMEDVGYPKDTGIAPFAISEAFPLFSKETVETMRAELFRPEVWDNCLYMAGNSTACIIRGHCPKYTPFMSDALTHPETLKIISNIAGIDLVPVMDFELGNILVSSTPESVVEHRQANSRKDSAPGQVTNWHFDHYPFVCVVMLSDTSDMVGGETAIKTNTGEVHKVRGPEMGCATVMQGRYINHQALAAMGGKERISMITSFRPRDPTIRDDSSLKYITRISDPSELYFQFGDYRLEILEERLRRYRKDISTRHAAGKPTDIDGLKKFLAEQIRHLGVTDNEIVEVEKIKTGRQSGGSKLLQIQC